MFDSPKIDAIRDWVIVLLVRKFKMHPGPQMEITSEDIEIRWTEWIQNRSGSRPRASNVFRRFRGLREEWRTEERELGENASRLRQEAGIIGCTRLRYSPLRLSMTQALSFGEEDCPLLETDDPQTGDIEASDTETGEQHTD